MRKIFAVYFTKLYDVKKSVSELNADLKKISYWAY